MGKNQTLDEILSSEIKRDIAERYFGFRKLIEEDKLTHEEKVRQYSYILQKRISFDLLRIYILLREEKLISEFQTLIGISHDLFYDPYLVQSANITQRVLACQRFDGLFRYTRFRNFIISCYENLLFHSEIYQKKIRELLEDRAFISEEIKQFYRENDLSVIMHFLKSMSAPEISGSMQGGLETNLGEKLDRKLAITPPLPIEQVMVVLPPLKPLHEIRKPLKKLIKKGYAIQSPEVLAIFDKDETGCDRAETVSGTF